MKTYLLLLSLLLVGACVQEMPKQETSAVSSTGGSGSGAGAGSGPGTGSSTGGSTTIEAMTPAVVRVKNYNQYNQTLEKLTKLSRAKYNSLFEELKGSLPADNDIGGLTSFNLIAMTRLSDAYCKDWVDREETAGLSGKLFPMKMIDVRDYLINTFLDVDKEERFASLRAEVENVLSNEDGAGGDLFPSYTNTLGGNKSLVVGACVAILASPYITLLE